MTLKQLRDKATASEITLIDTVLKHTELEAAKIVKEKLSDYLNTHQVPTCPDSYYLNEAIRKWALGLVKALD